ncbi:hypothetical protein ACTZGH_18465 [Enterobacter ludwigii]|uniref:hypothetical protein n=1 Tax=Enterobacter cloacae complex TaxID=354276 RepID=UPI000448C14B|nr:MULTISPECIES: hypothetical protein [Enterobacter cloacae complex]EKU0079653.1 hypothetical protein [Citrobacter farmeri]EUM04255.1 hypothetical protein L466_04290 [Enterobacter sp. BIDMC 30]KIF87429.1 hypothetical protein QY91_16905 [Enterobacter ludwigii]QWZ69665.1 hypothetical protein I6L66_05480 [Enterobacter ludwigii]
MSRNPWEVPEWHALGREASLVCNLIGSGATAIGRANYADKMGEYYTAFFGLSVGLERLSKLILVAHYAIENQGRMPDEKVVRKFGHKLIDLTNEVENISKKMELLLEYKMPTGKIPHKILECLDSFADARRGRYANFASLGNPSLTSDEPINKWWGEVAECILEKHYYGTTAQRRVEGDAELIDAMMSRFTMVLHTDETGNIMQDVKSSSTRTGQNVIVQKWGRYYSLTIARWLATILSELSQIACYKYNIEGFFGLNEHFYSYTVDDSFLKTRKIWPLK